MIATAGDMLLDDIVANPRDDGLRLIYADWLEDEGQIERAEFIRAQIELAGRAVRRGDEDAETWGITCRGCELARDHDWFPRLLGQDHRFKERPLDAGVLSLEYEANEGENPSILVDRGFASTVRLPLAAALQHLPTLTTRHPLTRVELTDFVIGRPRTTSTQSLPARIFVNNTDGVQRAEATYIPECIGKKLTRGRFMRVYLDREYETDAELLDDLSEAWLAWARATRKPTP